MNYSVEIPLLDNDTKHRIIEYLPCYPNDLCTFISLHINDDFLDPCLYNKNERRLSPYCTIGKYLDSKRVTIKPVTFNFDYQLEYSYILNKIDSFQIPQPIRAKLRSFMIDYKCYNYESLIRLETAIAEYLENTDIFAYAANVAAFINDEIMPFKLSAYDFYTFLQTKNILNLDSNNYDHLSMIQRDIKRLIMNTKSGDFLLVNDLATFIYIYMKEIGITDCFDKYHLFNRFKYYIRLCRGDEFSYDVKSKIDTMISSNVSITNALSNLVECNSHKHYRKFIEKSGHELSSELDDMIDTADINGINTICVEDFLVLTKNHAAFVDDIDKIIDHFYFINEPLICKYMNLPEKDSPYINFSLNENDYGHLKNLQGMAVATLYNNTDKNMYYIGKYDDVFYLFFKLRNSSNTVYGISLDEEKNESKDRKIFSLKENQSYKYVFIPNI